MFDDGDPLNRWGHNDPGIYGSASTQGSDEALVIVLWSFTCRPPWCSVTTMHHNPRVDSGETNTCSEHRQDTHSSPAHTWRSVCVSLFGFVCVFTFSSEGTSRPLHFGPFSSLKKSYCGCAACMAAAPADLSSRTHTPGSVSGSPGPAGRVKPWSSEHPGRSSRAAALTATILGELAVSTWLAAARGSAHRVQSMTNGHRDADLPRR